MSGPASPTFVKRILPGQLPLCHCFGVCTSTAALARSARIDTPEKWRACYQFAVKLANQTWGQKYPLRLSFLQLNQPHAEWRLIQQAHGCLFEDCENVAHINLPTPLIYEQNRPREPSEIVQKALHKLHLQFNSEGWETYTRWLSLQMMQMLQGFKPEASEEYQLQAYMEDFLHEVNSALLKTLRREIKHTLQQQDGEKSTTGDKEAFFRLETILVQQRERLAALMHIQCGLLDQIVVGIEQVEDMHPELKPLKWVAAALHTLIMDSHANWGQQLLLLQFVDQQLHVVALVNGDRGYARTNFAFAIRLALLQLMQEHALSDILQLCLHWQTKASKTLTAQLARYMWANCVTYNVVPKSVKYHAEKDLLPIASDFLAFFPPQAEMILNGTTHVIPWLAHDPSTQAIIGMTKIGQRLLHRYGLII